MVECSDGEIRGEWCMALAARCQVTVGVLLTPEPGTFERAMQTLASSVPPPASPAEQHFLRDRLFAFALRAGSYHHRTFHRQTRAASCRWELEESFALWIDVTNPTARASNLLLR